MMDTVTVTTVSTVILAAAMRRMVQTMEHLCDTCFPQNRHAGE